MKQVHSQTTKSQKETEVANLGADPQTIVLDKNMLAREGLDYNRIETHARRIAGALSSGKEVWLPVISACNVANGGVIPWKAAVRFLELDSTETERRFQQSSLRWWCEQHLITCIPAAGAASRYLGSLQKFVGSLETQIPGLADLYRCVRQPVANEKTLGALPRKDILESLDRLSAASEFMRLPEHVKLVKQGTISAFFQSVFKGTSLLLTSFNLTETKNTLFGLANGLEQAFIASAHRQEAPLHNTLRKHWLNNHRIRMQNSGKSQVKKEEEREVFGTLSHNTFRNLEIYCAAKVCLELYAGVPKALVDTTLEGDSFLLLKQVEQVALLPSAKNFLIVPDGTEKHFEEIVRKNGKRLSKIFANYFELQNTQYAPEFIRHKQEGKGSWEIIEQGKKLSTIRFNLDCTPYTDSFGNYSLVAAGHGELLHLFSDILQKHPSAECMHIRNIDNIIGSKSERAEELAVPTDIFRIVRDVLEHFREQVGLLLAHQKAGKKFANTVIKNSKLYLHNSESLAIFYYIAPLLGNAFRELNIPAAGEPHRTLENGAPSSGLCVDLIYRLMQLLFHWDSLPTNISETEQWELLYQKLILPLSVFGVVRKETGDVGGGPVFVQHPTGQKIKICMEMPHANKEDAEEYFGARGRTTHFNPVLVFFEMQRTVLDENFATKLSHVDFGQLFDDSFWLLSRKDFEGKKVCYHETVLYELLGNSAKTNLIFVEVPRTLFFPHKTIFDSMKQDRRSYGFHETLKETD